jgi:hypothetical protein
MKTIDLETTDHDFKRGKPILNSDGSKKYSIYKCTNCKMRAKRYPYQTVVKVSNDYDYYHITHCLSNLNSDSEIGNKIKITSGKLKGTIHTIVRPSIAHVNGSCGVWIRYNDLLTKILFGNFIKL